jgi:hypothetical protein
MDIMSTDSPTLANKPAPAESGSRKTQTPTATGSDRPVLPHAAVKERPLRLPAVASALAAAKMRTERKTAERDLPAGLKDAYGIA